MIAKYLKLLVLPAIVSTATLYPGVAFGQSPKIIYDQTHKAIIAVHDIENDLSFCSPLDAFEGSISSISIRERGTGAEKYYLVLLTTRGKQTFNIYLGQFSLAEKRLIGSSLLRKGKKLRVEYQTCGNAGIEYVQNLASLDDSVRADPQVGSLTTYEGKYPFDLLRANPPLKQRLRRLLANDYQFFMTSLTAQVPIERERGVLVLRGWSLLVACASV